MDFKEIDVHDFCDAVSRYATRYFRGAPSYLRKEIYDRDFPGPDSVIPEQVFEVIGGLANLYLGRLMSSGEEALSVKTYFTFASKYVSVKDILGEIQNCSGISDRRRFAIASAMQIAFQNEFVKREMTGEGSVLVFKPLGTFTVTNLSQSEYVLTYQDPAREDYDKFLLSEKKVHYADQ